MQVRKRHVPQRSCVICGTKTTKLELVRVVLVTEGDCVIDETGKRAGRGAYLCHQPSCWETASKSDRLARALRGQVKSEDRKMLADYGASLAVKS
jgi:predicted RNA-binding protein YlxR (DUF448 family)